VLASIRLGPSRKVYLSFLLCNHVCSVLFTMRKVVIREKVSKTEVDWESETTKAEAARAAALKHLEARGIGQHNQTVKHDVAARDNTLQVLRKRKAKNLQTEICSSNNDSRNILQPKVEAPKSTNSKEIDSRVVEDNIDADNAMVDLTPELPVGWLCVDGSGLDTPLFMHEASGCTTTKLPRLQHSNGEPFKYIDFSVKEHIKLPVGWKTLREGSSGRLYFWHTRSGKVQWSLPAE